MFSLPSLASRKPLFTVLVIFIVLLLAASISQTVESAATQQERSKKTRRYPNLDVRITDPQTMSNIARTNASNIMV